MLTVVPIEATPIVVVTRPAEPPELRWVCATWARAMRATTIEASGRKSVRVGLRGDGLTIDASTFTRAHHYLVDALIAECKVLVATLPELPSEPCGWVAFDVPIVHFVFVTPVARRAGVARQLLSPLGCSAASHMTPSGEVLTRYLRHGVG